MYCGAFLTALLAVTAIVSFGYTYMTLSYPGGGKGGFFVVILSVLNRFFYPLLGDYAISGSYIVLTLISGVFTYYYYKKSRG